MRSSARSSRRSLRRNLQQHVREVLSLGHKEAMGNAGRNLHDVAGGYRVPFSTVDAGAGGLARARAGLRIDHLAAQQQLVAADSDLALAESTLKRCQYLYEEKVVSQQEFDEVNARHQAALARRDIAQAGQAQARAVLNQARTSLEYSRIRAPFNGIVTHKKADSGTLASPGMPIFTVEDTRRYRLEVAINESDMRYARTRGQVSIAIEALGDPELKGNVVEIVPAADPASRAFLVKIELPTDTRLRSGLFGRARFSRGKQLALLIPRSALVERGQLQGVFVLDQNKFASLRYVTLGKSSGSEIEVLTGLQAGEWLVAKPGELDLSSKRIEGE